MYSLFSLYSRWFFRGQGGQTSGFFNRKTILQKKMYFEGVFLHKILHIIFSLLEMVFSRLGGSNQCFFDRKKTFTEKNEFFIVILHATQQIIFSLLKIVFCRFRGRSVSKIDRSKKSTKKPSNFARNVANYFLDPKLKKGRFID